MDAELATSFMGTARQILWALYGDYGLKPERIDMGCDGVCAGEFAHVARLHGGGFPEAPTAVILTKRCTDGDSIRYWGPFLMKFTHYKPGRAIKQFIPYA